MKKTNIIVFGDLPIASKVCDFILKEKSDTVNLIGVVIGNDNPKNNDPWNFPLLKDFAASNNIKVIDLDKLPKFSKGNVDFGILCRFSKILKSKHIDVFEKGVINFHGGLLPEYGGLYSVCHTILNDSKIGGGTIHYIDEGIDTGNILKTCQFEVTKFDTAVSVFKKTQLALYNGFCKIFDELITGQLKSINQDKLIENGASFNYYDKKSLVGKKEFWLDENEKDIDRKIRAFTFPGHDPAYFKIGENKYNVTFSQD